MNLLPVRFLSVVSRQSHFPFQATTTLDDEELAKQFPVLSNRMNAARAAVDIIPPSPTTSGFLGLAESPSSSEALHAAASGDLFGRVLIAPLLVEHMHTPHCKLGCALRFAPHVCSVCNHEPSYKGAAYEAAFRGDVPGLHAALAAGASTEEADKVRATVGVTQRFFSCSSCPLASTLQGRTALTSALVKGKFDVAFVLVAYGARTSTFKNKTVSCLPRLDRFIIALCPQVSCGTCS